MIKPSRLHAAYHLMEQHHLDTMVFGPGANLQYLTNANDYHWQRSCMTNIRGHSTSYNQPECLLVLTNNDYHLITIKRINDAFDHIDDYHKTITYMDYFEDVLATLVHGRTIGIGYPCRDFIQDALNVNFTHLTYVDCEDILKDIRKIKDEDEINQLKAMAQFTDTAMAHVIGNLKFGMSQHDAESLVIQYGLDHDCDDLSFPPTVGFKTKGEDTAADLNTYHDRSILKDNTCIAMDIGYMNHGYCSDWGRSVYFGKPSDLLDGGYHALMKGQIDMVNAIQPGITTVDQLYPILERSVIKSGYGDYLRFRDSHNLGHQIGIDCHEFPMINKQYHDILMPGMVFCSEPKMWFPNEGYIRIEDMILIQEDKAVFLSNYDRNQFIL